MPSPGTIFYLSVPRLSDEAQAEPSANARARVVALDSVDLTNERLDGSVGELERASDRPPIGSLGQQPQDSNPTSIQYSVALTGKA